MEKSRRKTKNKLLLDTHIFIWLLEGNKNLSQDLVDLLKNPKTSIFLSVASVWEIIIKRKDGKLKTPQNIQKAIHEAEITVIPISISHVVKIESLSLIHRDPFDRMLIAQTIVENLTLVTADSTIQKYKIPLIKV